MLPTEPYLGAEATGGVQRGFKETLATITPSQDPDLEQ